MVPVHVSCKIGVPSDYVIANTWLYVLYYVEWFKFRVLHWGPRLNLSDIWDWYLIWNLWSNTNYGFGTGVGLGLLSMEVWRNSNFGHCICIGPPARSDSNIVISFPLDLAHTWTATTISSACPRHFAEGKPCEWVGPGDITPTCMPLSLAAYRIKVYLCFLAWYMILEAGTSLSMIIFVYMRVLKDKFEWEWSLPEGDVKMH